MDEQAVREHAQAHADALLAGDIGKASEQMSNELRANLGPFAAMLHRLLTRVCGKGRHGGRDNWRISPSFRRTTFPSRKRTLSNLNRSSQSLAGRSFTPLLNSPNSHRQPCP